MSDRDDLDRRIQAELRDAWAGLEAPDATPDTGDEQTQAALDWMRGAWSQLEAPRVQVPARLRWRLLRGDNLPLAAAAAILVLFTGYVALSSLDEKHPGGVSQLEVADARGAAAVSKVGDPPETADSSAAETPPTAFVGDDGKTVVMEYGSVRLVLLAPTELEQPITNNPPTPATNSNTEPSSGFNDLKEN